VIVGFATAAMNRRWQIERTLPANLRRLRGTGGFIALVDYNSTDGLPDFVRGFERDLADGTLLYFRTEEPAHFHSSKSKNLAHRLALTRRPGVLFNLDADNFLGDATLPLVERTFSPTSATTADVSLHNWTTLPADGSSGRIALRADRWIELGGYDEAFAPAAWQDMDLLMRGRAIGLTYILEPGGVPPPVPNSMTVKLANLAPAAPGEDPTARYLEMWKSNLITSFGRPVRLPFDRQQPFTGSINFGATHAI
jgi:hypothetical protein